jgi:hypothetical protein
MAPKDRERIAQPGSASRRAASAEMLMHRELDAHDEVRAPRSKGGGAKKGSHKMSITSRRDYDARICPTPLLWPSKRCSDRFCSIALIGT